MPISNFSDIGGYICGWDAIASAPTYSSTNGTISNFGTDLSGAGSTFANTNTPRFQPGPYPGVLLPVNANVGTTYAGIEVTLPSPPAGNWYHRKVMALVIFSIASQSSGAPNGAASLWGTTGTGAPSALKGLVNGSGGVAPNGFLSINGGNSSQNTLLKNGDELQVAFQYGISTAGAFGGVNVSASVNVSPANSNNNTFTKILIGLNNSGFNPGAGVTVHAFHIWALDDTTGAGVQFTAANGTDAADLAAMQWNIERNQTKCASICGDSIGFVAPGLYPTIPSAGASAVNSTLTANASAGQPTVAVANRTGLSGRIVLSPGTDVAETLTVSSGGSGAGNITFTTNLRYAHSSGDVISNSNVGFCSKYTGAWSLSKKLGPGSAHKVFNFSVPGSQANQATANPSSDGSQHALNAATDATAIFQRGSNDLQAAGRTAAQLLADAETYADNARSNGADKVIVCQVMDRVDFSGAARTHSQTYNAAVKTNANGKFDAVARFAEHPWLTNPSDTGSITVTGATGATTVTGVIWDPIGVHPWHFGNACMALMVDKAYSEAWGVSVGYAPSLPILSLIGTTLVWSTPASPNAPKMYNSAANADAPSCLLAKIRRNGALLATIAPATINTNTGVATYTTSYDTGFSTGTFSIEIVDAAGNSSGLQTLKVGGGGGGGSGSSGMSLMLGLGLGGGGGGGLNTTKNAVYFDGTPYLVRNTGFGSEDTPSSVLSCFFRCREGALSGGETTKVVFAAGSWLDINDSDGHGLIMSLQFASTAANSNFTLSFSGSYNNGDYGGELTPVFSLSTGSFNLVRNKWYHVLFTFLADNYAIMCINDRDDMQYLATPSIAEGTSFKADTNNCGVCTLPLFGNSLRAPIDLHQFWFSAENEGNAFIQAQRRYFINANGTPKILPADGLTPYSQPPEIYLPNPAATVQNNAGTAGNFTKSGTPVDILSPIVCT